MSSESGQSDLAISVRDLSKSYRIYGRPEDRLKQVFFWGRKELYREFWALRDISFDVRKGESVGIIGMNGAGKSTLLQIIAGTTQPTSGSVMVDGRVAALLELGSGFNPEFTGRENVFMNGSVLGLSHEEIEARYDDIVAFADIGEFINDPIKLYSSGMVVRLAFAVAVHVDADILIVDEALSVGDLNFQGKCISKMRQILEDPGKSLLFVSHAVDLVKSICKDTLLLKQGHQVSFGPSETVCDQYMALLKAADRPTRAVPPDEVDAARAGRAEAEQADATVAETNGYHPHTFPCDLSDVQASWQRVHSGKVPPGRYAVRLRTRRSRTGETVAVRGFTVSRHRDQVTVPLMDVAASGGWKTIHAQSDDEHLSTDREGETIAFEFTGHELRFEAHRQSNAGAVEVTLMPLPRPVDKPRSADELYAPSEDFERQVAQFRSGTQACRLTNVELFDERGEPLVMVPSGEEVLVRLHMWTDVEVEFCNAGCVIRDRAGRDILTFNVFDNEVNWPLWREGTSRVVEVRFSASLAPGVYVMAAGLGLSIPIRELGSEEVYDFCPNAATFEVIAERSGRPVWGAVRLPSSIEVIP